PMTSNGHEPLWLNPAVVVNSAVLLCVVVAAAALLGWYSDLHWLRSIGLGDVSMKANTAVALLVCAGILLLANYGTTMLLAVPRAFLETGLVVFAVATLSQYVFGIDLGIDQLLVPATNDLELTSSPGRMAPTTAVCFLLFAAALIADHWATQRARFVSRVIAVALLLTALASILGYTYGAPVLYLGIDGVTAMALTTAVLFMALAMGAIWLRPNFGVVAILRESSFLGSFARSLLPMVIVAPLVVGAIVAAGFGTGAYGGAFAIALSALGSVIAAGTVAIVSVLILRRSDNTLYIRERALAATTNGIIITDHTKPDEPIVYVNMAFCEITGYSAAEVIGQNCRFLNDGVENQQGARSEIRYYLDTGTDGTVELRNKRKDGREFWNRLSLAPVQDHDGRITHYVGIVADVTVKREQAGNLKVALESAEEANELRQTFVRLVGHELRTPLNAALTWIRLMELDDRAETIKKGMSVVAQSIESQSRLIDDLVDVSRFTSSEIRLEPSAVDIQVLLEKTIEEVRPSVEPDLELQLVISEADYTATADPLRLQQIIRNLVSNALRYTPKGGSIFVGLDAKDGFAVLSVADTGKGLSSEEIKQVFEPFWRADANLPGLGVGLSIVSALVEAHGGTIEVKSSGHGQGCKFTVRLPMDATLSGSVPLHKNKNGNEAQQEDATAEAVRGD
ncbi:MAG: PAS domain-containing protein, partial [Woeseia sp.]|nr:PAS domain-containing protein [Woeseia sp.]